MAQNPFTELVGRLRQAGLAPDAEAIAEALWFAQFQPPSPARSAPPDDGSPGGERPSPSPPPGPSGTGLASGSGERRADSDLAPPPPPSPDSRLFPGAVDVDPRGRRASPMLVPDASALPGSLEIGRALRPFGRRRPAPHRRMLDEEGTAEATARFGFVRPVLLPFPERWFNVALVVDGARSMDVWQKTIEEFEQLLARQGAFAQVSRWRLLVSDGIAIESAGGQRREPSALHDPRGRTLVVIATNGVASFWDGDAIARVLADWSARAPVAILQLFSESRWSHTVIGPPTRWVRATVPGAPGGHLAMERKAWERAPPGVELLAVPVLSLAAGSVARWAEAVMAMGQQPTPAVVFAPGFAAEGAEPEARSEEPLDPRARVERFRSIASREAFRLACHLAAVPLALPIMRIVHQQICRPPRIEELGEVLASGLLERLTPADPPVDSDAVLYDFVGEDGAVRDVLLGALPLGSVFETRARVQSALKEFIERQLGRAIGNFRAFVLDEHGEYTLPPAVEAFVEIERKLLQRLRPPRGGVESPGHPGSRDWAVVVGVSTYRTLPTLVIPELDARRLAEWISSPAGGQVPGEQVRLLLSPARASEIDAVFQHVLETVQRQPAGAGAPVWRRLYLCLIGHGVALPGGSPALLAGDASPAALEEHVDGRAYADFFARSGYFKEIVLVIGCDREPLPVAHARPPPFTPLPPSDRPAKQLTIYGPLEEPMPARWGSLVQALVNGLSGGGADASGNVTVHALRRHLAAQLVMFRNESVVFEADFPEREWVLAHVEPNEGEAIIHFSPVLAGTDALLDGLPLDPPATDRWSLRLSPGVHIVELPAAGISASFTLPPGRGVRVPLSWALRDRRVLVAGTGSDDLSDPERWMSEALGQALAVAGFSLVTGGWQGTDQVVAAAYAQRVSPENIPAGRWLTQVVAGGRRPRFEFGRIITAEREFRFPMGLVEAVVLIGGRGGTLAVFEQAREAGKRVYPLPGTGGEARRAFEQLRSDSLQSDNLSEVETLRHLDVPADSPEAAQRLARTLVERLLAAAEPVQPQPWAISVVVTPGAVPVLQRDLPADWQQVVVIPVDRSGTVRLNEELISRLALRPTVAPPSSGFYTAPAEPGSPAVTWAFLVTLTEPNEVRETSARNLCGLLTEYADRARLRIWLPLLGREGGGLTRAESLGIILRAIGEAGVASAADLHFVIATAPDIDGSELIGLRRMVEEAAGRPMHDVQAALAQEGITAPGEEIVALVRRAADLMQMQRPGRDNGRINTRLALLALLEAGVRPDASPAAAALLQAWNSLAPVASAPGSPMMRSLGPPRPRARDELGPIVFSRDFAEVLRIAAASAEGAAVDLAHIVDALLEQATARETAAAAEWTGALRVLHDWNISPAALRALFKHALFNVTFTGPTRRRDAVSLFTKLPLPFYEGDAFDDFSPAADFRIGTARAMAWLSQLAYETDEPDKIERILGVWGLRLVDGVIAAEVATVLPIASTRGFVAAGRGATFVAFAGTDPVVLANWITDFDTYPTATEAAAGYAEAAAIVWDAVAARVAKRSAAENRVFVAGHSLGGALAAVTAQRMAAEGMTVPGAAAVYTFGMPRAGDSGFKRLYDAAIGAATYRLVHGADLVPTVVPSELGFRHVGRYLHCPHLGTFSAGDLAADTASDDPAFVRGVAAELRDFMHEPLYAAQDALAQLRLAAAMAAGTVPPDTRTDLGGILRDFVNAPRATAQDTLAQLRLATAMVTGAVPPGTRTDLGGILIELLPPRLRDHMMDRYCAALWPQRAAASGTPRETEYYPPRIARTRKDVWTLGNTGDDLFWYQKAVGVLQSRPVNDPTSWRYLAAVHGHDPSTDPNTQPSETLPPTADQQLFWNQCQHQSWYFLPWHRAYLACFEEIVAAAVVQLGGPPDWALPYWNYSDAANPNARQLHPFFVARTLADGSPNPLWVEGRNSTTGDFGIPDADVALGALRNARFTGAAAGGDPGFGGPKTIFSHFGGTNGRLEDVPHNQIHDDIGGLMGDPDTAALDPIFWLHHANIDRLWEVWTHRGTSFHNPNDPDWLAHISFEFHDAAGNVLTFTPGQVVDPAQLLRGYQYDNISDPFAAAPRLAEEVTMITGPPPQSELAGASAQAAVLDGPVKTVQIAFRPHLALASRARPARTYLNLENVTGTGRLAKYDIYIDVPPPGQEAGAGRRLFAGSLSTFGVQKASRPGSPHGGSGITTVLDITEPLERLRRDVRWEAARLHVTFVRRERAGQPQPGPTTDLQVGRISVYYG